MNLPAIKLPPGVLEEGVLRIDSSGYSHVLNCWRDAWHSHAWRRVLAGEDWSLVFGKAIHAAKDVRFKGWGSGPYGPRCMRAMEEALRKSFTERVKCEECEGNGKRTNDTTCSACRGAGVVQRELQPPEGDWRALGRAIEVMAEYDKLHPRESFEVLASELAGERELGTVRWTEYDGATGLSTEHKCKVIWQFKIDRVIRDRETGRVAVMDTKTTKEAQIEQVRNEFRMAVQFKMYCWAATELGRDKGWGEVLEADVDHIIVRKPLQRAPGPNSRPRNEFNRVVLTWTPGQIEECRRGVLNHLGAWLTACGRWNDPPEMNGAPRHCHQYTRSCQYLSVCPQADEQSRMAWLQGGNFVDNVWDPMEAMK